MQIKLSFLGAAQNVTGSQYLIETNNVRLLVDCGLYQERELIGRNWSPFFVPAKTLDAVLLTHAHLDHSGLLPKLVREGFNHPIYCTAATSEITRIMLLDSANLQQEDVEFVRLCSLAYRMLTFCGRYDDARALAYQFSEQLREASTRLYHAKDYELSLKYAETWLAIDSDDNDIRWLKARCLTRLERFEEAEKELEELQRRGYRKDRLYHAWGLLRRDQELLDEAIAFFIKGLEARANYLPLLRDFGDIQERMGDSGGALETLAKAYDLAPRDPYIAPKYADLLMKAEKPADALTVIDGALAAFPEEAAFEHRASMILDELGRGEDAYSHAKKGCGRPQLNHARGLIAFGNA